MHKNQDSLQPAGSYDNRSFSSEARINTISDNAMLDLLTPPSDSLPHERPTPDSEFSKKLRKNGNKQKGRVEHALTTISERILNGLNPFLNGFGRFSKKKVEMQPVAPGHSGEDEPTHIQWPPLPPSPKLPTRRK